MSTMESIHARPVFEQIAAETEQPLAAFPTKNKQNHAVTSAVKPV